MNESKNPNLFVFDFDHRSIKTIKRDAFSMHSHNCYELILFIKGDAFHVVENRKYRLSKNDLVIIRPSEYHYIQINSNTEYERYDIMINADLLGIDNIDAISKDYEVINLSANPIALELFAKFDFYKKKLSNDDFQKVAILLIKELFFNLTTYKEQSKNYTFLSPTLTNALSYINENLFTIKSVNEIAHHLFMTQSYLFRIFKQELKTSPKRYINDKRLLSAQNMLMVGKNPLEVFETCGFNDYTTFYRSYVKFFGHAPSKAKNINN